MNNHHVVRISAIEANAVWMACDVIFTGTLEECQEHMQAQIADAVAWLLKFEEPERIVVEEIPSYPHSGTAFQVYGNDKELKTDFIITGVGV